MEVMAPSPHSADRFVRQMRRSAPREALGWEDVPNPLAVVASRTPVFDAKGSIVTQLELGLAEKLEFLSDCAAYGETGVEVQRIETHMSWVFLVDERAFKLKKPVRFPYLDFSTLAAREKNCRAELTLNRRLAPDVYLAVAPLTSDGAAGLAIDGAGEIARLAGRHATPSGRPNARSVDRQTRGWSARARSTHRCARRFLSERRSSHRLAKRVFSSAREGARGKSRNPVPSRLRDRSWPRPAHARSNGRRLRNRASGSRKPRQRGFSSRRPWRSPGRNTSASKLELRYSTVLNSARFCGRWTQSTN